MTDSKDQGQKIATLDPTHTVALFIPGVGTLEQAASTGAKTIVNFRASGEEGGISTEEEHQQTERLGLNYLHHPVTADSLDAALVDDFRRSLDDLPQPALLHCASGKRAGVRVLYPILMHSEETASTIPSRAQLEIGAGWSADVSCPFRRP